MWRVRSSINVRCSLFPASPHSTSLFTHARARNLPARSRCVSLRERRVRVRVRVRVRRSLLALVLARVH